MPDIRVEYFVDGWQLACYARSVAVARDLLVRFTRVRHPVRALDADGVELMRRVHPSDTNSYAEG